MACSGCQARRARIATAVRHVRAKLALAVKPRQPAPPAIIGRRGVKAVR